MVRVPTYANYMNLLSQTMSTKALMDIYSYQATTGIKYSNYGGYGMSASNIVNMEASLSVVQSFSYNNVILNTTIESMSTVMQNVEDAVSSFKSQLNNALSALSDLKNGEPVSSDVSSSVTDLQMVAYSGMSLLSDALNTSVAGKYIFGAGSSSAPTKFEFTTLDEFQSYYDGVNIKYPSTANANLSSRVVKAADGGDLTISHDAAAADNEFVLSATGGFTSVAVTGGEATTGDLTFSAVDNTLKAEQRGAFNTIGAGDTLIFTDENGQNKAYIVESVSTDGKTITFSEDTPVVADATYTDGVGANGQAVSLNTSFAVGTVINFSGSDDVAPVMQVVGIQDNGDLIVRADESYFGNLPVTVSADDKWTLASDSYYTGGSATETFRVSENQSITLDINANDSVFDKLFRAFGQIAQGNLIQTDENGNVTNADEVNQLVNDAMNLLQSAIDNNGKAVSGTNETLSFVIAKISANYVTLDNVQQTLDLTKTTLENNVYSIKNVDQTEATVKLLTTMNSLSASYEVLNNVMNLSLLDYLN